METRDFICVCLGVEWQTVERVCENFDIDIIDSDVYEILDLLEGKRYQRFGDLLMKKLFQDVEDRAVEELKLDRGLFDWYVNGLDTHLYYNQQEVLRWEGLEDIASLNDEE